MLSLPYNTGAGGYNGHRIYGAATYLANGRYLCFFDEDNWYDPHHISSMMGVLTTRGLQWVHALRKIIDNEGRVIGRDNCQSLGRWAAWDDPARHLVDVNCYLIRCDIAVKLSPIWQYHSIKGFNRGPDFVLCENLLKRFPDFDSSGHYTVNYKVENTASSARASYFVMGNEVMRQRFPDGFPWAKYGAADG